MQNMLSWREDLPASYDERLLKYYDLELSWLRVIEMTLVWNIYGTGMNTDSSLENSLKAMEKNAEYAGQPENLALVHVIERPITVHYEDSDKGTVFGECFTDRPSIDIFIIQENVTTNEN